MRSDPEIIKRKNGATREGGGRCDKSRAAAGAVVETKKKAEEEAKRDAEEAMNEFFAATKVTHDLIGQAAMEAERRQCEFAAALKNHIKELAIAMEKQRI